VYYLQLKLEAAHVRTSPSKNKKTGFSGGGGSFAAIVDFIEKNQYYLNDILVGKKKFGAKIPTFIGNETP
jgi:hypothetical protein